MKNSIENTFPLEEKKTFLGKSLKKYVKWFLLDRYYVSTVLNEAFIKKYFHYTEKLLLLSIKLKRWFSLAEKGFSFNFFTNSRNESFEPKRTVSTKQKIGFR